MTFSNSYPARRLVLVVDDESVNRHLLGMILSEDYDVIYAENGREALALIHEKRELLSLVLLDLLMPEMDGFTLIETLRADEELRRIPIIVLTSEKSAELRSLRLGAADFITKPYDMPEVILARVWRIIELSEGRSIIRAAEKDPLTGLYTMNFFEEYAQQVRRYEPNSAMDAVALNIDRFHMVNDLYGREFGDRVLITIAEGILGWRKERGGIACRAEADMFYLYWPHCDDYDAVLARLEELLAGISRTTRLRLRVGVYPNAGRDEDVSRQFDRAKVACNRIRDTYAKSILIYDDEMHRREVYAERLINDIQTALEEGQLKVYYQPKYDIRGDRPRLHGAEALVRWQHPELGMVGPNVFIPLFERNGLIRLVDRYVWRTAAAQAHAWREEFGVRLPISVNVSRVDLYDPDLAKTLLEILKENDLTTADLLLEITESAYAEDTEQMLETVQGLRERGFLIEMDDFGSGYSSLNMLAVMPIDVLKLDMKFIQNVQDGKGVRLIELIMDIVKCLGVPAVAEGVETAEQCRLLKEIGCDVIQGYYFSRPVPPEEFKPFFFKEGQHADD